MSNNEELHQQVWTSPGNNSGFKKLRNDRMTDILTYRNRITNSEYDNTSLVHFSRTVIHFLFSIVHVLHSSLSATTDWAWGAPKLLYSLYRFTSVGESFKWFSFAVQSRLAPSLRREYSCTCIAIPVLRFWAIMACSTFNVTFCQAELSDAVCCNTSCIGPLWW
jgi:hypothetical protein